MPHRHIQKALFHMVTFIKQSTLKHKKKLATLVVIALLTYIAKKRLRFAHLITITQYLTRIISYLPLPEFPTYRQLNRYESPKLNSLAGQIIESMKVEEITGRIKQKTGTWESLKSSIFTGVILSLLLYNIQSLYFVAQNKYQKDFLELQAIQTFEQMMGAVRKKFLTEIPSLMQTLATILQPAIQKINIRQQYTIDEFWALIDSMLGVVFSKKFTLKKQPNQHVDKSIFQQQQAYDIAKNYFLTPLNYIAKKKSTFSKVINKITSLTSSLSFTILKPATCQTSQQRFQWSKIAYQIPLKKSATDQLKWPNRESQLLSKLVLQQIDQVLTSINFSTLLYQHANYNATVVKNRLFLYFSKKGIQKLRTADALAVIYKLLKEQVLISGTHSSLKQGEQNKRHKFYESQILKAIRQKNQSSLHNQRPEPQLLFRSEPKLLREEQHLGLSQQSKQPSLILLNMHLQQIYMSRQVNHLVKEFEIKYFNERSGVTLNPMQRKTHEQDEMKKLLNMLGDNHELNRKEDDAQQVK